MNRIGWPRRVFLGACALFIPLLTHAETSNWNVWIASQINQHPDILAEHELLLGVYAGADASEQPLYNPELSTDLERNGQENNYRIGVQQTIDWWDKREARQQQAEYMRSAAVAQYQQQVLDKTAEAISALIEWDAANQIASITQVQKSQLDALLNQVEMRQQAGDLSSIDAELTFLSLSQRLTQVAEAEAAIETADIRVRELLPEWTPKQGGIPEDFWPSELNTISEQDFLQHPVVASAQSRWQALKREAEVTRRASKAEPTIGFNAGRDGGNSVVELSFSIPLHVRNNYSAETRAAEQLTLEAEARFQAVYRRQRLNLQAAQAAWQRYERQYRRWHELSQDRIQSSAELLERQWRNGDLSITDYLLALNQRAESLLAGIELEKQTRLALTTVLLQSGRLPTSVSSNL